MSDQPPHTYTNTHTHTCMYVQTLRETEPELMRPLMQIHLYFRQLQCKNDYPQKLNQKIQLMASRLTEGFLSLCFVYLPHLPFPTQSYIAILRVHSESLLHSPEDNWVHILCFSPLVLLIVACHQNRLAHRIFFTSESYDYLSENLLISGMFFVSCHPTQ